MKSLVALLPRCCGRIGAILLLLALVGCRGCHRDAGPGSVLELAAADSAAAVWVPDVRAFVGDGAAFAKGLTKNAGAGLLDRFRTGVKGQLGLDPTDPEALSALGLRLEAGALLFNEGDAPKPVLALGVSDRQKLDDSLVQLVKRADGANKREVTRHGQHAIITVGRPFGDAVVPVLHWAHFGRFVLLAHADGRDGLLAVLDRLSAPPEEGAVSTAQSLSAAPRFLALRAKVPAGGMHLYVRGGAAAGWMRSGALAASIVGTDVDAMTSISLSATGIAVDTWLAMTLPEMADAKLSVENLAGRLEPGTVAYFLSRGAHQGSAKALREHPVVARLLDQIQQQLLRATGIDAEKEALPRLAGPITAAVYVADLAAAVGRLRGASRASARAALQGLLDAVHVVVTAELTDPEGMKTLLARSQKALGDKGIKIRARAHGAVTVYEPDRPEPKLAWTIADNLYVYTAGRGRLDSTLGALAAGNGNSPLEGSVAKELASAAGATVLVVRAGMLADALGGAQLGDGAPVGVAGIVAGVSEMLRTLGDVAMSFEPATDGLRIRIREKLK